MTFSVALIPLAVVAFAGLVVLWAAAIGRSRSAIARRVRSRRWTYASAVRPLPRRRSARRTCSCCRRRGHCAGGARRAVVRRRGGRSRRIGDGVCDRRARGDVAVGEPALGRLRRGQIPAAAGRLPVRDPRRASRQVGWRIATHAVMNVAMAAMLVLMVHPGAALHHHVS